MEKIKKGYDGILQQFIKVDKKSGEVHIHKVCAVAGLGGYPYRDGSYEYYVYIEPIRPNDGKGTGPFMMACVEMELAEK